MTLELYHIYLENVKMYIQVICDAIQDKFDIIQVCDIVKGCLLIMHVIQSCKV